MAAAAVSGGVAFAVSERTPPQYRATAQLFLLPGSAPAVTFQDVSLGQTLARSYVQLATAEVVLLRAMESVDWSGLDSFRARTTVAQVRDTSVINVGFVDSDPERAAAAANAIADSFIAQSRALHADLQGPTLGQLDAQIRALEAEIVQLDQQIAELRTRSAALPVSEGSAAQRSELQAQILQAEASRLARQQALAPLLKTRDDMRLTAARAEHTITVWQRATRPSAPESPYPLMNGAFGALAGALIAFGAIWVVTYLDNRLKDVDDIRALLQLPALGQVHLEPNPETLVGKLFMRRAPASSAAEAFRTLRTNVLFANVDKRPRSILVTSALSGEGKTVVSANLAMAFAEAGIPTVLIDADLRRPGVRRLFPSGPVVGLTSLLTGALTLGELEPFRVLPNLTVIPSGPLPANPAEILSSHKMASLIDELVGLRDGGVVIIDTSPLLPVADAIALSTKVDGVVLVIDAVRTSAATARRAVDALGRVRAPILGAVLNKARGADMYPEYYGPPQAAVRDTVQKT